MGGTSATRESGTGHGGTLSQKGPWMSTTVGEPHGRWESSESLAEWNGLASAPSRMVSHKLRDWLTAPHPDHRVSSMYIPSVFPQACKVPLLELHSMGRCPNGQVVYIPSALSALS